MIRNIDLLLFHILNTPFIILKKITPVISKAPSKKKKIPLSPENRTPSSLAPTVHDSTRSVPPLSFLAGASLPPTRAAAAAASRYISVAVPHSLSGTSAVAFLPSSACLSGRRSVPFLVLRALRREVASDFGDRSVPGRGDEYEARRSRLPLACARHHVAIRVEVANRGRSRRRPSHSCAPAAAAARQGRCCQGKDNIISGEKYSTT